MAMALPIPFDEPVIMATLFCRLNLSMLGMYYIWVQVRDKVLSVNNIMLKLKENCYVCQTMLPIEIKKKHIEKLLESFETNHQEEIEFLCQTNQFIRENQNLFGRDNLKGHITGSAWVINPSFDAALLIHHKKIGKWFQPGGHIDEDDTSIVEAAKREALEETGIKEVQALNEKLFDLDVHTIPERKGIPEHLHYDLRFAFIAQEMDLNPDFLEVHEVRWISLDEIISDPEKYGST
ncbi:MAG: NUDIX hydrolase, partial [Saprospiraceae bacterium]|nr:NUDIX hydrolase [Saprospiraceae bacterium]